MDFDRDPVTIDLGESVRILFRDGHEKGDPEHFAHGTVNEVIPQAIRYMRDHFEPIIHSWTTA